MLMAISRTPYRVSFFGGGTDYPAWFRKHGGAVLSIVQQNDAGFRAGDRVVIMRDDQTRLARPG